jgi:hypothetical protein
MDEFGAGNLLLEWRNERSGQQGDAILLALTIADHNADHNLAVVEVYIFNSQAEALGQAHSGIVKQAEHQPLWVITNLGEDCLYFRA